jgi:preprotein translocase subunit SecD
MDEGTTNIWGWIVNIISAGGAITGILAIFAWVKEDDFNPVLFGISAVGGILILINVHGTDGDEQVEHSREALDVHVSEGLPHGEGITGDE